MSFEELGVNETIREAIGYMGFTEPTPIQEEAIPIIFEGHDMIGCAQTGTGKTGAFLIPVLSRIFESYKPGIKALIVVPTRELAIQIDQQIEAIAYTAGISSIPIYGGGDGDDWDQQKRALTEGADVIVATPGKLISHLNMGYVKFENVEHLILDEADRMLDIGFYEDIMKIVSFLPKKRQNLMFSATMAPKIRSFAKEILHNPKEVNLALAKPAEGVLQASYLAFDDHKSELIVKLISDKPEYKSIIIFSSTKRAVSSIVRRLNKAKLNAEGISSDLDQEKRESVLLKFRNRKIRVLVATDVISRGIDIKDINLVINYNVPQEAADYVHRVGRTARADTTGVAITLINPDDMVRFKRIEDLIEREIIKLPTPPDIGPSPEWRVKSGRPAKKNFRKGKKGGGRR